MMKRELMSEDKCAQNFLELVDFLHKKYQEQGHPMVLCWFLRIPRAKGENSSKKNQILFIQN